MTRVKNLTAQEKRAVEHFVATGMKSKTESIRAAYKTDNYKSATLHSKASQIFARPHVKDYIDKVIERQSERFDVEVTDIKRMLLRTARIGFQEVAFGRGDNQYVKQLDPQTGLKALDQLNKMGGNYAAEKRELTGPGGGPIVTRTLSDFYDELEGADNGDA